MNNQHQFSQAELAYVETKTAKSGNVYATGIIIERDENDKFQSSHRFRSFNAVDVLKSLEAVHFSKQSAQPDTSGGDLEFDDTASENTESRDRTVAKATARPRIDVSGWFRTTKQAGKWDTVLMIETVNI